MGGLLQEEGVVRHYGHRGQLRGLLGWLVHDVDNLVEGLNALGVPPRDLITILQNIKAAGALQAEIESR